LTAETWLDQDLLDPPDPPPAIVRHHRTQTAQKTSGKINLLFVAFDWTDSRGFPTLVAAIEASRTKVGMTQGPGPFPSRRFVTLGPMGTYPSRLS